MLKTATTRALIDVVEHALDTGAHQKALEQMRDFWDFEHPEIPPDANGLTEIQAATFLLYCGIHYGFHGLALTIKGAQEHSKDLLTAAYDIFKDLQTSLSFNTRDKQQIISLQTNCANYLAVSYWRMGDIGNAELFLRAANSLHTMLPARNAARLYTYIVESLINYTSGKHADIIEKLQHNSKDFIYCGNAYITGLYYMNLGTAMKNTGDLDGAIYNQLLARDIFQKLRHWRFYSYTANNIANFYRFKGEPEKAKGYVEVSLGIAKKINDLRQIGCAYDTYALLAYDVGDYEEALKYSNKAITELKKTECYGYLVEYYITKIKILRKTQSEKAFVVYHKAMTIADKHCASLCEQLTAAMSESEAPTQKPQKLASTTRRLKFRKGFEPVGKITLFTVPPQDFARLRLAVNSIVVVEKIQVNNGDFAVIEEIETGDYFIGKFDSDFGFVSLEAEAGELEVFNDSDVKIKGKIIGYFIDLIDKDGYYQVISFE